MGCEKVAVTDEKEDLVGGSLEAFEVLEHF
jgi:hypothetical protein